MNQTTAPNYKWIVLSNTTLGVLIATINSSILLIALPDIFRGLNIDPLAPGNSSYLLWLIMGYLVVTAVLVVSFGRLGDMYGRVRMYNAGFAIFTIFSVLLTATWLTGTPGVLWLIVMRIFQGVGGALLMGNSNAIITDAFPADQRGLALGLNMVAAIAGAFLGLVIGGVLAPINWHLVFLVSVPVSLFGTVWAYLKLHDNGVRHHGRIDWWGNLTFGVGLISILVAITYGIQPYAGHIMGWTNPWVFGALIGGAVVLAIFCVIEMRVPHPMFHLDLFRIRKRSRWNIGWGTRISMTQKMASTMAPPMRALNTHGLVHPMMWPAYGWIPYVMATRIEMRPTPKVRLPHQSMRPWWRTPLSWSLR